MKFGLPVGILLLLPAAVPAHATDDIAALIQRLGSPKFEEREMASQSLKHLPESVPALRAALESRDLERRRRVKDLLDYHDEKPVRDMEAYVKGGGVDRFVELMGSWPNDKFANESWHGFERMIRLILERHEKQGGTKFQPLRGFPQPPRPFVAKRISEDTAAKFDVTYLLRCGELDIDYKRRMPQTPPPPNPFGEGGTIAIATRSVRLITGKVPIILAGGSVQIGSGTPEALIARQSIDESLIISGGDITINKDIVACLVIARGKVTLAGSVFACHIISGKTIEHMSTNPNNILRENELNPLGYIRWSDPPKAKAVPKSK